MECINSHKKYRAKNGAPFKQEEAQVIGETLDEIRISNGGNLKSETIVEEAKSKKNPLHKFFEWNNDTCGEKYRLQQARDLTNHIVEEIIVDGDAIEQRSFLSVINEDEEKVYVSREDAITNVDYKKQLLDQMISTLENLTVTIKLFRQYDYHE
jgi:hypothetical protein